jgi:hypothetical protein
VGAVASDPLDGEILDGAEQLGLGGQREVGHFVEKQRAAVGVLELAPAALDAGGRALLDAEQLRLEQGFHECRAIDGHERAVPSPAQVVDLAGHQLLPHSAFAPPAAGSRTSGQWGFQVDLPVNQLGPGGDGERNACVVQVRGTTFSVVL